MTEADAIVFVIDDDAAIREALESLVRSVGLQVETFRSPREFLKMQLPQVASCLVLDVRLPGVSGLDFHRQLAEAKIHIPVIFITGHGDIPMSVRAMKAGAVEFLTQDLLDAIQLSLKKDRARREREGEISILKQRFQSLTPREQEVLPWVVSGKLNKQIAAELGTSEATVKVHRSQLMRKMGAESLADLVRMADKMKISVPGHP
jgi:FixJ family two-component response regulator